MKTKFVVGDVVVHNGKQCVVYVVELYGYELHGYEIDYRISDGKSEFWVAEDKLKSVY